MEHPRNIKCDLNKFFEKSRTYIKQLDVYRIENDGGAKRKMNQYFIKTIRYSSLLTMVLLALISQSNADPTVMITDYSLEPETMLPGDTAILTVTISNTETTATKTETEYEDNLPISQTVQTISATLRNIWITSDGDGLYTVYAHDNYRNVGDLSPGNSITLSFALSAHENLTEGFYFPIINVDVLGSQNVNYPFPVRVGSYSATILAKDVPKMISSSGSTPIILTVVNNRKSPITDVIITADVNQSISVSPASMYIGTLNSEASQDITCSLHPSILGKQNISFKVTFRNGKNIHNSSITIPIEVIKTYDVSPVLYTISSSIAQHDSKRITLEVYNAKSDTITGVTVIPVTNFSISPTEYFIGSMNSDDVFSASFDISSDELEPGNYSIGFKVAFKQGNNYFESPTISKQVAVTLKGTENESIDTGFLVMMIGIILLIFIIVLFIFRKRRITK